MPATLRVEWIRVAAAPATTTAARIVIRHHLGNVSLFIDRVLSMQYMQITVFVVRDCGSNRRRERHLLFAPTRLRIPLVLDPFQLAKRCQRLRFGGQSFALDIGFLEVSLGFHPRQNAVFDTPPCRFVPAGMKKKLPF
jgi:hypothetical protein